MHLLWFLLIGIAAGWLAGLAVRGSGFGVVGDLVVGVVGAFVGGLLFGSLGYSIGGDPLIGQLLTATLGAVVLLLLIRLVKRT